MSGKRFCHLFEMHGWELKRINGSHHVFARNGEVARISVPVLGNSPLKIGLQRHLMKLAGIEKRNCSLNSVDFRRAERRSGIYTVTIQPGRMQRAVRLGIFRQNEVRAPKSQVRAFSPLAPRGDLPG